MCRLGADGLKNGLILLAGIKEKLQKAEAWFSSDKLANSAERCSDNILSPICFLILLDISCKDQSLNNQYFNRELFYAQMRMSLCTIQTRVFAINYKRNMIWYKYCQMLEVNGPIYVTAYLTTISSQSCFPWSGAFTEKLMVQNK